MACVARSCRRRRSSRSHVNLVTASQKLTAPPPTRTHLQAEEDETKTSFGAGRNAERAFPGLGQPLKKKGDDEELFPSLGAAAKAPKKKGKPVKMSLSDFAADGPSSGGGGAYRAPGRGGGGGGGGWGGGNDDNIALPTGPSARDDDEDGRGAPGGKYGDERIGGAFKDYGGDRGGGFGDRGGGFGDRRGGFGDRSRSPPRRGGFGGDRDGGFDPRDDRDRSPPRSRADDDSNWGKSKASAPPRSRSPPRGGGFGDRRRNSRSRSRGRYDSRSRSRSRGPPRSPSPERDWGALRNRTGPPARSRSRSRSPERERDWGALRNRQGPPARSRSRSRSPAKERDWGALRNRTGPPPREERDERPARGPRPGQRADDAGDRWGKKEARDLSPRGDRDGGRPRLNLAKRSEKGGGDEKGGGSALFGGARPREQALKEAGRDYRKEDMALARGSVRRKESDEEKAMKDEIMDLTAALGDAPSDELKKEISDKEEALAKLSLELDDKVRFAQREEKAREEQAGKERRERREPRGDADKGNWGEGKADRAPRNGGGRGGDRAPRNEGGGKKEERKPREPRVVKVAEESGVKIASSSFAALAMDDEE